MEPKNTATLELPDDWQRQYKQLARQRLIHRNIIVFMLQYAGLMFTTLASPTSLVWFASGTATAFLFLRGLNILPSLWLASALAFYMAGQTPALACLCASLLVLQAFLIWKCSYRSSLLSLVFFKRSDLAKFLLISALISGGISILLCLSCFPVLNSSHSKIKLALEWGLANFNGSLILACALFTWDAYFPDIQKFKQLNKIRLFTYFGLFMVFILGLLNAQQLIPMLIWMVLLEVLIIQLGRLYAWCGVIAALFTLALALAIAGLFELPLWSLPQDNLILELALFLSFCTMSGMASVLDGDK